MREGSHRRRSWRRRLAQSRRPLLWVVTGVLLAGCILLAGITVLATGTASDRAPTPGPGSVSAEPVDVHDVARSKPSSAAASGTASNSAPGYVAPGATTAAAATSAAPGPRTSNGGGAPAGPTPTSRSARPTASPPRTPTPAPTTSSKSPTPSPTPTKTCLVPNPLKPGSCILSPDQ